MTASERWELRHPDGTPADSRVIGIVGDEATVVAGVPYGTAEERQRAALLVASPRMLAAMQRIAGLFPLPSRAAPGSDLQQALKELHAVINAAEARP